MDKYGTIEKCQKCGCKEFSTRYEKAIVKTTHMLGQEDEETIIEKEYIARECRRCHYVHKEAPLDAIESKGE